MNRCMMARRSRPRLFLPVPEFPTPPRPAASLLVMRRDDTAAVQLLMARRAAGHRFMPHVLVFPGGAVDEADYAARIANPLRPSVQARLERSASARPAQALGVAAARELTEEVGMSLGDPPALAPLAYPCRAVTPPDRNMRFDARFFVVQAAHVSGDPVASAELEEPGWYTMQQALAGHLALATKAVLGQFERWLTEHDRDGKVPVLIDRQWRHE